MSTQNTELNDQVSRLNKSVNQLVSDSTARSINLTQLKNAHYELSSAYDLLLDKNTQMIADKAKEYPKGIATESAYGMIRKVSSISAMGEFSKAISRTDSYFDRFPNTTIAVSNDMDIKVALLSSFQM